MSDQPEIKKVPEPPSEEVKKIAFEKIAQIKIYQLFLIAEVINLASARGAFRGPELSHVGALFDTISTGIDQSFKLAQDEIEKAKLEPIKEEGTEITEITEESKKDA